MMNRRNKASSIVHYQVLWLPLLEMVQLLRGVILGSGTSGMMFVVGLS